MKLKTTLAIIVMGATALAAHAQVFDVAADFSSTTNPNGAWQYGYARRLGGTFTLYDAPSKNGTTIDFWGATPPPLNGGDPNVSHNPTADPIAAFDFLLRPRGTAFHPGPNGEISIYRWTAPATARFSIQAEFTGLGVASTTDVHVLANGVSIFDGLIRGPGTTAMFEVSTNLTAGSTVDFAVGPGGDGYSADTTGINARIAALDTPLDLECPPLTIRVAEVELCWPTASGHEYQLQYRSGVSGGAWVALHSTNVMGTGSVMCFSDRVIQPPRFYRLLCVSTGGAR